MKTLYKWPLYELWMFRLKMPSGRSFALDFVNIVVLAPYCDCGTRRAFE